MHGVSFEEAQWVFLDENAVQFYDEVHSDNEDRYIMIGLSSHLRLLLISIPSPLKMLDTKTLRDLQIPTK